MADTIENLIAQMNSANQSGADITTLARGYDATQALIAPYEETSKRLQQQINQLENIYGIDAREGSDFDSGNYTNPSPAIVNQFNSTHYHI